MTIVSFGFVDNEFTVIFDDDCIEGADENLLMGDNEANNEYGFAAD